MIALKRELRVGLWFAGSIALAFGAIVGLGRLLLALGVTPTGGVVSGLVNIAQVPLVCFASGLLAGASLGRGKRAALGFGTGFAVGLPVLLIAVIAIQGMTGEEAFLATFGFLGGAGAIGFGLLGLLGTAIADAPRRVIGVCTAAFAASGTLGGLLLTAELTLERPGQRDLNQVLTMIGLAAFFLVPVALGGAVVARRMDPQQPGGTNV